MLKNAFRKLMGILIVGIMGVAVFQYFRQTAGNEYVGSALAFGLKVLLVIALALWVVFLFDRRLKKGQQ